MDEKFKTRSTLRFSAEDHKTLIWIGEGIVRLANRVAV